MTTTTTYRLGNSSTSYRSAGTTTPLTFAHTTSADTMIFALAIHSFKDPAGERGGGSPTFNGKAMTLAGSQALDTWTDVELWYQIGPDIGTALTVSIPDTTGHALGAIATSYASNYWPAVTRPAEKVASGTSVGAGGVGISPAFTVQNNDLVITTAVAVPPPLTFEIPASQGSLTYSAVTPYSSWGELYGLFSYSTVILTPPNTTTTTAYGISSIDDGEGGSVDNILAVVAATFRESQLQSAPNGSMLLGAGV